jgi:hypothetical protein
LDHFNRPVLFMGIDEYSAIGRRHPAFRKAETFQTAQDKKGSHRMYSLERQREPVERD